ncbi:uncharacterized protein GMORB2_0215 [Geosmithia morbida]|uniref:SET domain-containing protein n=1 Tax=Geosmithia morbida TaxID=1094350 RepID=A0A9P4Z4G5_9HYPO|nr:uncharacterized protein GMORB2_0215 [Geosmithia morbida]KAF4126479.1 uncharacterized protein GMORB2_0215 [Geosmithia morbida]
MTDSSNALLPQYLPSSQTVPLLPPGPVSKDEVAHKVESVEEEPYTIKCICNFTDDDGNTIYCETCDTWQHIECFYPDNREEAIREDFAHACAECNPRPLNRQKAIERAMHLRRGSGADGSSEKKSRRPPSKSHKKKPRLDAQLNGATDTGKNGIPGDQPPPAKKNKSSHRPSQSVSSQPSKRSPSYSNLRTNPVHPPSPATSPPNLPDDFQIHHYSAGFCALYSEHNVPDTQNNAFASLAIPTALSRWLRDPETLKKEVGRSHAEVFQDVASVAEGKKPKLEVKDILTPVEPGRTLRLRFLKSATPVEKDVPLIELNGEIGFQKDYCSEPGNLWANISSPLPFVFFHPVLPLYIDTRKEGSLARYVRRSCKPNAQLDTYLHESEYHFWLVSDRYIAAHEQITLPWDFRLKKDVSARWLQLLGLSDDDGPARSEPDMDEAEYIAISNWIDHILSEYGGCACELENNCAFARFHRHYLHGRSNGAVRPNGSKKKQRKQRTHTISPTSTGHASRAPSEGHPEDGLDQDTISQSGSRSKPSSRDPTPNRQGSLDRLGILTEPTDRDKRKVAMVEDSFRRMEQQQPPRKKKRVSDGTSSSSKSRQLHTSVSGGQYVDTGAGRSKSGSPSTVNSPTFTDVFKTPRPHSVTGRSRHTSANPRPVYCNAAIQTDPVEGEWFSSPPKAAAPRRRVISLAQRLLDNRKKQRADEERRRQQSLAHEASPGPAMEIDSPTQPNKPLPDTGTSTAADAGNATVTSDSGDTNAPSKTTQPDHAKAEDAPTEISPPTVPDSAVDPVKMKPSDLQVQMPPVPTFDGNIASSLSAATPQSTTSSVVQPPFPPNLSGAAVNGANAQPSPAKKKLSLSDYTKRSMNKAKTPVVSTASRPTLLSPEEAKPALSLDTHNVKSENEVSPTTTGLNGHP